MSRASFRHLPLISRFHHFHHDDNGSPCPVLEQHAWPMNESVEPLVVWLRRQEMRDDLPEDIDILGAMMGCDGVELRYMAFFSHFPTPKHLW